VTRPRRAAGEKPLHWAGSSRKDLLGFPAEVVYVLHAFQKKSPSGIRTSRRDVRLIEERLGTAREDHEVRYGGEEEHDRNG